MGVKFLIIALVYLAASSNAQESPVQPGELACAIFHWIYLCLLHVEI